jgi:hypothetical protein
MDTSGPDRKAKVIVTSSIVVGAILLLAGFRLVPTSLAHRMSPDGVFADGVLDRAALASICRWGILAAGALFLSGGILMLAGRGVPRPLKNAVWRRDDGRGKMARFLVVSVFALLAFVLVNKTIHFAQSDRWKSLIGYEYYWIAEGIAGGHGYSLAANHRWYFDDFKTEYPADQYYPTALEEPIYPYLLAFSFTSLGEYGRLYPIVLNVVLLYLTSVLVYLLARKVFGSRVGIFASVALLTWWWFDVSWMTVGAFSPAIFGGFNIILSAYVLLWFLEKISVARGVVLGFVLGFSCLTLAAGQLFVPLAALLALVLKRPVRPLAWAPAAAIVGTFLIVLSPWTLRNYRVFGQLVPIRTGFGLALHQSNPALAATFSDAEQTCVKQLGPIWRARDAKDAIQQVRTVQAKRMAMYKRSYDCVELEAPRDYSRFSEPRRDKVYLAKSVEFIRSYPKIFLALTRYRIQAFLVGWSPRHTLVTLLAICGTLLAWRNRKAAVLVLLVAAYVFPFSLATPLMYRYRYPIEPVFFTLACGIPAAALAAASFVFVKLAPAAAREAPEPSDAEEHG